MSVRYNHFKKDLEKIIIETLFNVTKLDEEIKDLIGSTLAQTINFDTPNSDHTKVDPPKDSIMKYSETIHPLDAFTKLRRRVIYALWGSEARLFDAQQKLKDDAVSGTEVMKYMRDDGRIGIKISNNSQLVLFLSRGEIPSMLRTDTDLEREYNAIFFKARDMFGDWKNYPKDVRTYIGVIGQVLTQLGKDVVTYEMNHESITVSPKILPRRVLHASAEQVGKEFIKNNIV